MADKPPSTRSGTRRDFPQGIPVTPPPGWRPRTPPPLPPRPPRSAFHAQAALVLKAVLVALLVMVCMGVGWLLTKGRRTARVRADVLASAGARLEAGQSPKQPRAEKPDDGARIVKRRRSERTSEREDRERRK